MLFYLVDTSRDSGPTNCKKIYPCPTRIYCGTLFAQLSAVVQKILGLFSTNLHYV